MMVKERREEHEERERGEVRDEDIQLMTAQSNISMASQIYQGRESNILTSGRSVEACAVAFQHQQRMRTHVDQMSDGVEGVGLLAVADVSDFF